MTENGEGEGPKETDRLIPPTVSSRDEVPPTSSEDQSGDGAKNEKKNPHHRSLYGEVREILSLAVPIIATSVSWVAMKTTDTAILGHVPRGSDKSYYLSVSAYADLWMSTTSIPLQGKVLGILAAPCLESGNTRLVGVWLQVSYFCLSIVGFFVVVSFLYTRQILLACGVSLDMATDAQYYAYVFIAALPARVLASQLSQYLSCQKVLMPSTYAAFVGMVGNLVLALYFVLGLPSFPSWWDHKFGFAACPIVTTLTEWLQPTIVMVLITRFGFKDNGIDTWPSDGWAHGAHVTRARCRTYFRYYLPAACSIASDFLRFSVIGFVAAKQSPLDLAVFNSSYRILWMCLIFTSSLAGAICIQVGMSLGGRRVDDARYTIKIGLTMVGLTLLALGTVVLCFPIPLAEVFSDDERIWDAFAFVRWPLALTMLGMNTAVALERIIMNLGYTDRAFYAGLVGSWAGQVPLVLLFTRYVANNLYWLYAGVAGGYILLDVLLLYMLLTCDWEEVIDMAMQRAEKKKTSVFGALAFEGALEALQKEEIEIEEGHRNDLRFQ